MENKEIISKVTQGDTSRTFLHTGFANTIIRILNKQWAVELPPGGGIATFRDSEDKVTLDLSKAKLGMGAVGGNTFEAVVYANGVLATTTLSGTTPVEI